MNGLNGKRLLQVWETCRQLPVQEAALALLSAASPQRTRTVLSTLPLNERDALLLELRAETLGRSSEAFAVCASCGQQLEFTLNMVEMASRLRRQQGAIATSIPGVSLRIANTLDLLACAKADRIEDARSILLARTCQLNEGDADTALLRTEHAMRDWLESQPRDSIEMLIQHFEQANAATETRLELHCASCGNTQLLDLDVPSFVLREFYAAARRLMGEIHELASAYGWSEASIATMSSARRAAYLEMQNL